jgi:hypothetical protein
MPWGKTSELLWFSSMITRILRTAVRRVPGMEGGPLTGVTARLRVEAGVRAEAAETGEGGLPGPGGSARYCLLTSCQGQVTFCFR